MAPREKAIVMSSWCMGKNVSILTHRSSSFVSSQSIASSRLTIFSNVQEALGKHRLTQHFLRRYEFIYLDETKLSSSKVIAIKFSWSLFPTHLCIRTSFPKVYFELLFFFSHSCSSSNSPFSSLCHFCCNSNFLVFVRFLAYYLALFRVIAHFSLLPFTIGLFDVWKKKIICCTEHRALTKKEETTSFVIVVVGIRGKI